MAFREVTMLEIKEVLRRWLRRETKSEISRQCGVSRGTVRSYIRAAQEGGLSPGQAEGVLDDEQLAALAARLHPSSGRPRGEGWQRCEEHRKYISKRLDGHVRLTKIRKLLRRQKGVRVSYATLRRFAIERLGFGEGRPTVPVVDGEPGKEVQLDTGWVGWLKPDLTGGRRRFRAWIFTPVVSRYRFVYPVFRETTETAIEACEAAWQFYGGVFDVVIPDNPKCLVQTADPLEPVFNLGFLEYAQVRGFVIDTARVGKATDKARVERTVRVVAEDCFGGEEPLDIESAREHALWWTREDNGMTRHGTTQRLPREHFESEEMHRLHSVPSEPYDIPEWSKPKVAPDQHAQVARALYSLPSHFRGHKLDARADHMTVRFYDRDRKLVKTHPRVPPGKRQTDPADFPPEKMAYAMRDVRFLVRKASEHGEAVGRYAEALLDSRLPWARMRQVYALLGLARRYGAARLDHACKAALEVELVNVYKLRRLLEIAPQTQDPAAPAADKVVPLARYLRPPQQYALKLVSNPKPEDSKGDDR
jgi:transposase